MGMAYSGIDEWIPFCFVPAETAMWLPLGRSLFGGCTTGRLVILLMSGISASETESGMMTAIAESLPVGFSLKTRPADEMKDAA